MRHAFSIKLVSSSCVQDEYQTSGTFFPSVNATTSPRTSRLPTMEWKCRLQFLTHVSTSYTVAKEEPSALPKKGQNC